MYQRSLNFCKQPVVVVVNVILPTEIAETYGLRQEKGADTWMGCSSARAHSVVFVTGCHLTVRDMATLAMQMTFYFFYLYYLTNNTILINYFTFGKVSFP